MSILKARYGEEPRSWQKQYSLLPLHIKYVKYVNKKEDINYRLSVSLRFFKIACGLKNLPKERRKRC